MSWKGLLRYLFTGVGALLLAGGAYLAMAVTQADPALASAGINAAFYSSYCPTHNVSTCGGYTQGGGTLPPAYSLANRAHASGGTLWNFDYPQTSGQYNPESLTAASTATTSCGEYWYAFIQGTVISTTTASGYPVGFVYYVDQWYFVAYTPSGTSYYGNGGVASWNFDQTAPGFVGGYPQNGWAGGYQSYPAGNPYGITDVMGFSIDGHATVWVGYEDPSQITNPANASPNQNCYTASGDGADGYTYATSSIWADQYPGAPGAPASLQSAVWDLYTDNVAPPLSSDPTADLTGAGTNLNTASPTLEWNFSGVIDAGGGLQGGDPNDYYASGTQYYNYTTWLDQNNLYETGPPTGVSTTTGTVGAGASGYTSTCLDTATNCSFTTTAVAIGYTAHMCISPVDWLGNEYETYTLASPLSTSGAITTIVVPATPAFAGSPGNGLVLSSGGQQQAFIYQANGGNPSTTLTVALSEASTTVLQVAPLTAAVQAGDQILVEDPNGFAANFTASTAAAVGATSINVDAQIPNYAYPAGDSVLDDSETALTVQSATPNYAYPTGTTVTPDSCGYQMVPNDASLTLTPQTQTLPDTEPGVLQAASTGAQTSESLVLEDTTTGVTSAVQESASGSPNCGTTAPPITDFFTLSSGEQLTLTDAGNLICNFQATPVADGTYNYEAALFAPYSPTSYSPSVSASVTWVPWKVGLTANGQTGIVNLGANVTAQLVATLPETKGVQVLNLSAPPGETLEIFSATDSGGTYTPTGSPLVTCTSGAVCPGSSYLAEQEPTSTGAYCISQSEANSCFIAEVIAANGSTVLASSNVEVEWAGVNEPTPPATGGVTLPVVGLVGVPQNFWVAPEPTLPTPDNLYPETQTATADGTTYTLTPQWVEYFFGDGTKSGEQPVPTDCQGATANLSPNTCSSGGGYGIPPAGSGPDSNIQHVYEQVTADQTIPNYDCGVTASEAQAGYYYWCTVENFSYVGSDGTTGSVTSESPAYQLQMAQVQSQYETGTTCQLSALPTSGNGAAGAAVALTVKDCPSGTGSYAFSYTPAGSSNTPTTFQAFSSSDTATWNTAGLAPGEYFLQLQADNPSSPATSMESITAYYQLQGCSVLSPATNLPSPQAPGQSITLSDVASCAGGTTEYQFSYSGTTTGGANVPSTIIGAGYSSTSSVTWNTVAENLSPGTYTLTVSVYASTSSSASALTKSINFTLGGISGTCTSAALASSPATTAPPGVQVSLTAVTTCPSGTYPSYGFFYSPPGTSTLVPISGTGWSFDDTVTWDTTGLATSGTPYTLTLEINSNGGTTPDSGSTGVTAIPFTIEPWTLVASQSNSYINTNTSDTLSVTTDGPLDGSGLSVGLYSVYPDYTHTLLNDNPAAYWKLNETSGTTAADSTGNGNTGTLVGGVTLNQAPGPLQSQPSQGGMAFNGSSQYVQTSTLYNSPQNFSVAVWFKTVANSQPLLSFCGSGVPPCTSGWDRALWIGSNGDLYGGVCTCAALAEVNSTTPVDNGVWHLAVLSDSSTAGEQLYLDGTLVSTNASATTAQSDSGYWILGYFPAGWPNNTAGNSYYGGELADAAYFPSGLNAAQISALYGAATTQSTTTEAHSCNTGSTCSTSITGTVPGYYKLYGTLSTNPNITSNTLSLEVQATCTATTLTASPSGTDVNGQNVGLTATSSCSSGTTPQYAFFYTPSGGSLTPIQAMGDSATATWNTTGVPAGSYTLTVETEAVGALGGFQGAVTIPYTLTLQSQTITFTSNAPTNAVVGGATYAPTATASSGLPVTLTIDAASSAVCSISSGLVSFQTAGTCTIDANQAGNGFYAAAPQVQQSFVVKEAQTISFTSIKPTNAVVGGTTYTPAATASSGLPVTLTIDASSSTICSITGGVVSYQAVGTCTIDANQAGNATYTAAPQVQQSFTVGQGSQTIAFTSAAPSNATAQGATYTPSATASSGLAVTFSIDSTSSGCVLSGGVVSFTEVGTCVIDANQAGNANWLAAPQVQQSFGVSKTSQSITFTTANPTPVVVGGTYTPAAVASSGLPVALSVDASSVGICSLSGGTITVASFGAPTEWSSAAFYGTVATLVGDITGSGKADLVGINTGAGGIGVELSTGSALGAYQSWYSGSFSFSSSYKYFLADVTGNGRADLVVVDETAGQYDVWVFLSTGTSFQAPVVWATQAFAGTANILMGDVTGDGLSDLIAVNTNGSIFVALSNGSSFGASTAWYSGSTFDGGVATFAADVTGNGKAAIIEDGSSSTDVLTSTGTSFNAPVQWFSGAFSGSVATLAGNITGNGQAGLVAMDGASTDVLISNGSSFSFATWSTTSYGATSDYFNLIGDFNGDGTADLIADDSSSDTFVMLATTPGTSGAFITYQAPGTCTIDANQAGNSTYSAAPQVQQVITVNKAPQTITFTSSAPTNAEVGGGSSSYSGEVESLSPGIYWQLNQTSGAEAYDSSGNGFTGNIGSGITKGAWAQPLANAPGVAGMGFSGAATSLVQDSAAYSDATGEVSNWSVSAWIKPTVLPTAAAQMIEYTGSTTTNNGGYGIGIGSGTTNGSASGGSDIEILMGAVYWISDGVALPSSCVSSGCLVAVTESYTSPTSTFTYYVNGAVVATITQNSVAYAPTSGFEVGAVWGGSEFGGDIAQVAVFNSTLSQANMAALYASAQVASSNYQATATATSGLAVSLTIDSSSTSSCSISAGVVSFGNTPGTCVIDANQAGNGDYAPAPQAQQSFTISGGSQTITFTSTAPGSSTAVDGLTYTVAATGGGSGNPVLFSSATASVCTSSGSNGSTITFVGAGNCEILATQAGGGSYSAAYPANQSFLVYTAFGSAVLADGPAAYWPLYDTKPPTSGTTAVDLSGNGLTGTLVGGVTEDSLPGIPGSSAVPAMSFNGSGSAVVEATNSTLLQLNAGTAVAWFKGTAPGTGDQGLIIKQEAYGLFLDSGELMFYNWVSGVTTLIPTGVNLTSGNWNFVAISFQSGVTNGTVVYVDGAAVYTGTVTMANNAAEPFAIGSGEEGAAQDITGTIAQVAIFPSVLTAGQIEALAQAGAGPQTITFTSNPPTNATAGGPGYEPTATASSGLPVTLTVDAASSAVCSMGNGLVTFQSVGTCTIDANQPGQGIYTAAPQVQQSFAVGKGSQSIAFTSTAPTNAVANNASPSYAATVESFGPSIYWQLNDSGAIAADSSGNGYTGNIATAGITKNVTPGPLANSASTGGMGFSDTANDLVTSTSAQPDATSEVSSWTLSAWFKASSISSSNATELFTYNGSTAGSNGYGLGIGGAGGGVGDDLTVLTGTVAWTIDGVAVPQTCVTGWCFAAVTYSGTSLSFYLNGALVATVTGVAAAHAPTPGFIAGGANGPVSNLFSGDVAQVAAFNSTLTAANIATIYNSAALTPTSYTPTATASSGLAVTLTIDSSSTSSCAITAGVISFGNTPGTCVIDANQAGNSSYAAAAQVQQTFSIGQGTQNITFTSTAPSGSSAVDGETYTVTATGGGSGNPVTFSIAPSTVCTPGICTPAVACTSSGVNGSTITFVGAGTCTIDANQAGLSPNYAAALQVDQSFTVDTAYQYAVSTDSPSYFWPLYDNNTVTAVDLSGNPANTGNLEGGVSEDNLPGIPGATAVPTMEFNGGTTAYIDTTTDLAAIPTTLTESLWFNDVADNSGLLSFMIPQTGTPSSGWDLQMYVGANGDLYFGVAGTSLLTVNTPSSVALQGWNFAAATVSGGVASLYLNGLLVGSVTTGTPQAQTGYWRVGETYGSGWPGTNAAMDPLNGDLADVGVMSTALNLSQIDALYSASGSQSIYFTSTAPTSAAVSGATYSPTAVTTAGQTPVAFSSGTTSICTVASGVVSFVAVGTCTIDANIAAGNGFTAAPQVTQSFTVGKGAQTITFTSTAPTGATIGSGATYTPAATATSGLAVTFSLDSTSTGCTLTSGVVSFAEVGTCKIDANQAGGGNYNAATQAQQSFAVLDDAYGTAVTADGPSYYWPLYDVAPPESNSTTAVDLSGNNNTGTLQTGSTVTEGTTPGVPSATTVPVMKFASGYISTATNLATIPTVFTESLWFKTTSDNVGLLSFMIPQTGTPSGGWNLQMYIGSAGNLYFGALGTAGGEMEDTGAAVNNGAWNFAVATVSGTAEDLYLNGSLVASGGGGSPSAQTGYWRLGEAYTVDWNGSNGAMDPFSGSLADVAIFPTALTSSQVTALAADGSGPQTISFTSTAPSDATQGGATYTAVATATSGLTVAFSSATTAVCSSSGANGSVFTFLAAGTCTIDANQAGDAVYGAAAQITQSFSVYSPQTISFTSSAPTYTTAYDGGTYTPAATATSGLAVTLTSATSSVCTLTSGVVSFVGAGTCTIDANQSGNGTYNPAPQVAQSFTVYTAYGSAVMSDAPNAFWPLYDDTSPSTTAVDLSGSGNTGNLQGGVVEGNTPGIPGSTTVPVMTFTGTSTTGFIDTTNLLTIPTTFTESLWFQYYGDSEGLLSFQSVQTGTPSGGWNNQMYIGSNGELYFGVAGTNGVTINNSTALTIGTWYDAVATVGSTGEYLYLNGVLVASSATGQVVPANQTGYWRMGEVYGADWTGITAAEDQLDGYMADVAVMPTALSQSQVDTLYSATGSQSIYFTSTDSSATVGGPTYTPTANTTSGQTPVVFSSGSPSVCTVSSGVVTFLAANVACAIEANIAAGGGFTAAPQATQTIVAGPGAQTITFTSTAPTAAVVGGVTYTPVATASSGLTVVFSSGTPTICAVGNGGSVSFLAAGTCTIDANQSGSVNYTAAPQVQQSFTVGAGPQTIAFTSQPPTNAVPGGVNNYASVVESDNPSIYWQLGDSGSTAADSGPFGYTGTVGSGVTEGVTPGPLSGFSNTAGMSFAENSNSVVTETTATPDTSTTNWTLSAWIKPAALPTVGSNAAEMIVNSGNTPTTTNGYALAIGDGSANGSDLVVLLGGVAWIDDGGVALPQSCTTNWCFVAASENGSTFTFYLNGEILAVVNSASRPITPTSGFVVGGENGTYGDYFDGDIAQVAAFNSTLTGAQISNLYADASGAPATYNPTVVASSGLSVTLTIDAASSGVCTISGAVVTVDTAGTCTIDANQAGSASYLPAAQVQQSFTVNQGSQTVLFTSAAPNNATVSGTTYNAVAVAYGSGGYPDGQTPVTFSSNPAVCTTTGTNGSTVTFVGTGTCILIASQAGNSSYSAGNGLQEIIVNPALNAYQNAVIADGPTDFWPLYDTGGTTAVNLGSNFAPGVLVGGVAEGVTPGIPGSTSTPVDSFNGTNGEVIADPVAAISGSYTVSAWFKLSGATATTDTELFSSRSGSDYSFDLQVDLDGFHGDIGTGSAWLTTAANASVTLSNGVWYQVTEVVTSTSWNILLNGYVVGAGAYAAGTPLLFNSTHTPFIGQEGANTSYFDGNIADVAIFSSALSAQTIGNMMEPTIPANAYASDVEGTSTSNLIGYWPLSDLGDTAATDLSGQGEDGQLSGSTAMGESETGTPGGVTSAYYPAAASAIAIPGAGVLARGNANFTIMAWVDPSNMAAGVTDMIFTKDVSNGASYSNWEIRVCGAGACLAGADTGAPAGDEQFQMVEPGGAIGAYVNVPISNNAWTMVTAEYIASGDYSIWVNGSQPSGTVGTIGGTAENSTSTPVAYIGARADGFGYFEGEIADVAVWNVGLTPTQIGTLYSDG